MENYTKFEAGGLQVWTRTIHQTLKKVRLDLNITLVFSRTDRCKLSQSAQSIIPGSMYTSRSAGISKALETSVERAVRDFLFKADVADQTDEELVKVVEQLIQVYSGFPPEKTSSLLLPIVLADEIDFENRLGHKNKLNVAILVPARGISVIILKKEFLDEWVTRMEETLKLRSSSV